MRPKKSTTLIKRSQTLMKTKQNFNTTKIIQSKKEITQSKINPENITNGEKKIPSQYNNFGNKQAILRTFSRKGKTDLQLKQRGTLKTNQIKTKNLSNNSSLIKRNIHQNKSIPSWSQKIEDIKPKNEQSTFRTTTKHFTANLSTCVTSIKEQQKTNKAVSVMNSSKNQRIQVLNTRKSKLQSQKKREAIHINNQNDKMLNVLNPLTKTRNINIHKINNATVREKPKQQENKVQQQKQTEILNIVTKEQQVYKKQSIKPRNQNRNIEVERSQHQSQRKEERQQINRRRQIIQPPILQITRNYREPTQQSIYSLSDVQQYQIQDQLLSNHSRVEFPLRNNIEHNRPQQENNNITSFLNIPVTQNQPEEHPPRRTNMDLTALISNTHDIIEFINRLNLRNRIQAFDLMVGQLTQLNLIAQQVQELGQMGNNLGYSLVNVFGTRIRELQTTIINQVGQALIASFEERMEPQFQALVLRQPALRNGFNKTDIQKTFQQKITFEEVQCSICLDFVKPGDLTIQLQCSHEYHPICIKTWLENSKKCPLCRKQQQRVES